jgi:multiple sugar transport system substrate-binding protein
MEQPVYEFMESDFVAKNPNVKLVVEEVPWADYFQKLLTQTAGGNAPDVMWVGSLWIPQFWAKGVVRNLDPYVDASDDFDVAD